MLDYQEIFNKETNELVAKGYLPVAPGTTTEDNLKVIEELRQRSELLERAIEELRIKKHAVEKARDERKSALPKQKAQELAEADMNERQKKHTQKIDRQVDMKKLQAEQLEKTLRAIGMSDDEIKATLQKKGLL